jgi:cyanophycin synthetase
MQIYTFPPRTDGDGTTTKEKPQPGRTGTFMGQNYHELDFARFLEERRLLTLRGPNIWAQFPVLEVWVDIKEFNDIPSNEIPGFNERLMNWLPTMIEHRCSRGIQGGFFERLRDGTYLAHIFEHVVLELQTLAGTNVGYGKSRGLSEKGVYAVVIEYKEEALAKECLKVGRALCFAAVTGRPIALAEEIDRLRDIAQEICLGPSTRSIVNAASARGIPYRRLNTGSLVMFGHGARQRRILASETDQTKAIAEGIAQDKQVTKTLLKAVGVPVPDGRQVMDAEDAWSAALEIELPVTVKPLDGSKGRGVSVNLNSREEVIAAHASAAAQSPEVLVEEFIAGHDYRLLVVGDQLIAAARREPAQVIGDGVHTISELIAIENENPLRGEHHALPLSKIPIDAVSLAVLAEQKLTVDAIPAAGTVAIIRRNANLSTGGTAVDVTDEVHPDIARLAVDAARVIGLDVAGIDLIARDISLPLEAKNGAVLEVNAAPGLRMHTQPTQGIPRPAGEAIISSLFAEGQTGKIPIIAVTGVNGKTTTTRFISHILNANGFKVGMTCTDGIYIDGRRIDDGDCSGPQSARAVLLNPVVEAAVLETARGGILREGLGFDVCDVAVVTNIGQGDHIDKNGIDTVEKLAEVKRTVVEAVARETGTAVLNAADPLVAAMAPYCPGKVVFFACNGKNRIIKEHRSKSGKVAFVENDAIVLAEGDREYGRIPLEQVPLTLGGNVRFQVENALAAIGTAWSLGLPLEKIVESTASFVSDMEHVPGRFNVIKTNGATMIVDYGHNASSLEAIIDALDYFSLPHRTIVYSTAGDRRDSDIVLQGLLLGEAFDSVILYEGHYMRGRQKGEIIGLFRKGMRGTSRVTEVMEIFGATDAMDAGLKFLRANELVVIQADVVDETIAYLKKYLQERASSPTPPAAVAGTGKAAA